MHSEVKGPTGPRFVDNYQQDYFFVADPLKPGGVEDVGLAPIRIGSPVVNGEHAIEDIIGAQHKYSAFPILAAQNSGSTTEKSFSLFI
jgi:hypothetical protein